MRVSKRLSDLEYSVRTQLLERSNRGIEPTPAGLELLSLARSVLNELDNVVHRLREHSDGVRGVVRVFANLSAITEFMPGSLAAFMVRHPEVQVQLQQHVSSAVQQGVACNAADVGLYARGCADAAHLEGLVSLPYRRDELVLVVPVDHPLANAAEPRIAQALDHHFVGLDSDGQIHQELMRAAQEAGQPFRCRMQVTSYDALSLMVAAGMGIAVMPRFIAQRYQQLDRIRVLALREPGYYEMPPPPSVKIDSGTVWALNDKLKDVYVIGEGEIEGAEDVILDRHDNLYGGSRHGDIIRFFPPDYKKWEVFAHIGGAPLGMSFDKDDNLHVCVGGMGVYRIKPDRTVELVTDETNRSIYSVNDDSRMRLADDNDIAPDGRIWFSEATIRYEIHDWPIDALEARGNGRIIVHDPSTGKTRTMIRGLMFPNGVCIGNDQQSILFSETWGCKVKRYYFDGPRKGQIELVMENLPGYPDNINWASDGNYWMSLLGMRSPALDLAWKMPAFRERMSKRVPRDEWLFPNVNVGCVMKFNDKGEVLDVLWDLGAKNHPQITSMREHRGYLFLGGLTNNRIGRYKIPEGQCDPNYVQYDKRWGKPVTGPGGVPLGQPAPWELGRKEVA